MLTGSADDREEIPVRWLGIYGVLRLAPSGVYLVWPGDHQRAIVAIVLCLFVALVAALCAGSRVAWLLLLVIEVGTVAALVWGDPFVSVLAALRLLLIVSPRIRRYVWRRRGHARPPARGQARPQL